MLILFGCFLIVGGVVVIIWLVAINKVNLTAACALLIIIVFVGLVCVFNERVSEITISKIGSIKTAEKQATGDAKEISKLKDQIKAQAASVDLVSKKAAEAEKIGKELNEKNRVADQKLTEIEDTLKKAAKSVDSLNQTAEFTNTVMAAQNDDRKAFDQLKKWSEDEKSPFRTRAQQAYAMIFNASAKPFGIAYTVPWKPGVDPQKLALEELESNVASTKANEIKFGLLQFISSREDIPLKDRLQYFANILREDTSLGTVQIAGECFTGLAKLKIKPLAVDFLLTFWAENRDKDPADIVKAGEAITAQFERTPTPTVTPSPSASTSESK